jgi:trigger factor
MAQLPVLIAGLLFLVESQASDVADSSTFKGFLSQYMPTGSDAPRNSMNDYDKFTNPNLNRVQHGNGDEALSEHKISTKDFNPPTMVYREENRAVQKLLPADSSHPILLSAIGIGLLSLATMLGVRLRRGLQPASDLASSGGLGPLIPINTASVLGDNFMEMKTQDPNINKSAAELETRPMHKVNANRVGWGQLSSHSSSTAVPCCATAVDIEESKETSSVQFTIQVPASLTKAAYKTAAGELAQTREIPGWTRKDWKKVPAFVVAGAVGDGTLKSLAIEKLSETEVHSAITGLNIEVVGQAQLVGDVSDLVKDFTPGEDWDMRVKIDVWPEAVWTSPWDDGTLEVTVEREAKDQSVRDKAMEALRERYCDVEDAPEGHVAVQGDMAIVDMDGYLRDPETGARAGPLPVQGAVGGDDLELLLEPGKFLPGVMEAIIGQTAGAKVTVPVDFPDAGEYRDNQPLAGVKAGFEVTVKKLRIRSIPEMNDAFAGKIRPGLTLAELQQEVENTVGGQEDEKIGDTVHTELEKALAARISSNIPRAMITESARQRFAVMLAEMRANGTPDEQLKQLVTPEAFEKYLKVVTPKEEVKMRGKVAIESIARESGIKPNEDTVIEQLELVKRQYEQQEADSGAAFNEEKAREKVESELLRIAILDEVKTKAKINYVDAKPLEDVPMPATLP